MLGFLIHNRFTRLARAVRSAGAGQTVTALLFVAVFVLVAVGVYTFLFYGFQAVSENTFLAEALPFFIYEVFLLVVSGLVFASAVITGIFSLFSQESDAWVLASPKYGWLLSEKLFSVGVTSLWPLLVIAVPAILAVHAVFGLGVVGLVLSFAAVLVLGVGMVALALLLIVALGFLARKAGKWTGRRFSFSHFLTMVALTLVILAAGSLGKFSGLELNELFEISNLDLAQAEVSQVSEYFAGFPSHLAAQTLSAARADDLGAAAWALGWLALFALIISALLLATSKRFLSLWQFFREGTFEARAEAEEQGLKQGRSVTFAGGATQSVLTKEIITGIRSARDLFWLGFLLLLWLTVTGIDLLAAENFAAVAPGSLSAAEFVQVLQLLVFVYFAAALVLRFIFPMLSAERDTAWIITSSPVSIARVFHAKAIFSVSALLAIVLVVSVIHLAILPAGAVSSGLFLFYALGEAAVLAAVGLSIGAIFPNFETTDPQKLSTTLSGLGFTAGALAYGSLGAYAFYLTISAGLFWPTILFALFSLGLAAGLFQLAARRLPKTEFTTVLES